MRIEAYGLYKPLASASMGCAQTAEYSFETVVSNERPAMGLFFCSIYKESRGMPAAAFACAGGGRGELRCNFGGLYKNFGEILCKDLTLGNACSNL